MSFKKTKIKQLTRQEIWYYIYIHIFVVLLIFKSRIKKKELYALYNFKLHLLNSTKVPPYSTNMCKYVYCITFELCIGMFIFANDKSRIFNHAVGRRTWTDCTIYIVFLRASKKPELLQFSFTFPFGWNRDGLKSIAVSFIIIRNPRTVTKCMHTVQVCQFRIDDKERLCCLSSDNNSNPLY